MSVEDEAVGTVPKWLVGLWHRRSMEEFSANGQIERDVTTQVFWLQTPSGFADIRVPANRDCFKGKQCVGFDDLTAQQAIALSQQDGFAGITHSDGIHCEWHHSMDYRPFNGEVDAGTLSWKAGEEGKVLVEMGPNNAYREEWVWMGGGPTAMMTLTEGADQTGWFVVCGDYFMYMRDRRERLPMSNSLTRLLEQDDRADYARYLDCEISFGRCQQGAKPWEITLSTLPWREGQSLLAASDLCMDTQRQQVTQSTEAEPLVWTVQEWGAMADLF